MLCDIYYDNYKHNDHVTIIQTFVESLRLISNNTKYLAFYLVLSNLTRFYVNRILTECCTVYNQHNRISLVYNPCISLYIYRAHSDNIPACG